MFRINAFGQRVYCNPRLRFLTDDDKGGQGGGDKDAADKAAADKAAADKLAADAAAAAEANGFPASTPLEQMTVEQREAYWKFQSKKHEKEANSRRDYDELKLKADELEQLKAKNQSAEEKALEDARRDGENIGAQRYLKDAVKGRFQGITQKTDEEVETIFEHVDPLTFTDDKGDIDSEKLKKYAATFGTPDNGGGKEDVVAAALARQRQAGGGSGSSIADKRKETRESMTRKSA